MKIKAYLLGLAAVLCIASVNASTVNMGTAGLSGCALTGVCAITSSNQEIIINNCWGFIDVIPGDANSLSFDTVLDYWNGSAWVQIDDDSGVNSRFPRAYTYATKYRVRPFYAGATGTVIIVCH